MFDKLNGGTAERELQNLARLARASRDALAVAIFQQGDGKFAGDTGQVFEGTDIKLYAVFCFIGLQGRTQAVERCFVKDEFTDADEFAAVDQHLCETLRPLGVNAFDLLQDFFERERLQSGLGISLRDVIFGGLL